MSERIEEMSLAVTSNMLTEVVGRDLAEDYSIVFAEQIKNAKDAGAKKVVIDFDNPEEIIITDDGDGTSPKLIRETWLTAGTKNKRNDINTLGGKGVGRFMLFSLGNKVTINTVYQGEESSFSLDKTSLNLINDVSDEQISVIVKDVPKNKVGTKIVITDLITDFIDINKIKLDVENLVLDNEGFEISIQNSEDIDPISWNQAYNSATLCGSFDAEIRNNEASFSYKNEARLGSRSSDFTENKEFISKISTFMSDNIESFKKIGPIHMELLHFFTPGGIKVPIDKNSKLISKRKITNNFLNYNSGINIYRKGFKIFGYGLNDWLDLENRSRNNSKIISNSRTAGRIILSPESESVLVERSSRESLKTNSKEFRNFKTLINFFVDIINEDRLNLKSKLTSLVDDTNSEDNGTKTNTEKSTKKSYANDAESEEETNSSDNSSNFVPEIKLNNKSRKIQTQTSVNLNDYIDFDKSFKAKNVNFNNSELIFLMNGKELERPQIPPQDEPKEITINVRSSDAKLGVAVKFNITVIGESQTSRTPLFISNNGKYYRNQPQESNTFFPVMIKQFNKLWQTCEYDLTIVTGLRAIADVQIDNFYEEISRIDSNNKPEEMGELCNNFGDVKIIVDFAIKNKIDIREKLKIKRDKLNNFFRKFENEDNLNKSGDSFKKKLQRAHSGAHYPLTETDPEVMKSIASNTLTFLSLSEMVLEYIKKS